MTHTMKWLRLLLTIQILCFMHDIPPLCAEPYIPTKDSTVLETLPKSLNPHMNELRDLRMQLTETPTNLSLALKLAQRYVQTGRTNADPRFDGYAQAALHALVEHGASHQLKSS